MPPAPRRALAIALWCCGCSKPTPGNGELTQPKTDAGGEPTTTGAEAKPSAPRFWIAAGGLRAYDLDGNQVASLGDFGDRAIRLSDGRIVAVDEHGERASLAVLSPDGQRDRDVPLPTGLDPDTCVVRALAPGELERAQAAAAASDNWEGLPIEVAMQSSRDFGVAEGQALACLNFIDRNENMASYEVSATVELVSGALASVISLDLDERCPEGGFPEACEHLEAVEVWIEGAPDPAPRSWPLSYDEDSGWLMSNSGERAADLCPEGMRDEPDFDPGWGCAMIEEVSSSGRWLLISGKVSEGDYIYRDLLVLDRSSGAFWRLIDDEGIDEGYRWEQITAERIFDEATAGEGLSVVGESEIGALPEDRFWIDGMLVIPERHAVVRIGGSQALMVAP